MNPAMRHLPIRVPGLPNRHLTAYTRVVCIHALTRKSSQTHHQLAFGTLVTRSHP